MCDQRRFSVAFFGLLMLCIEPLKAHVQEFFIPSCRAEDGEVAPNKMCRVDLSQNTAGLRAAIAPSARRMRWTCDS
jgi:hypothetical protein